MEPEELLFVEIVTSSFKSNCEREHPILTLKMSIENLISIRIASLDARQGYEVESGAS